MRSRTDTMPDVDQRVRRLTLGVKGASETRRNRIHMLDWRPPPGIFGYSPLKKTRDCYSQYPQ